MKILKLILAFSIYIISIFPIRKLEKLFPIYTYSSYTGNLIYNIVNWSKYSRNEEKAHNLSLFILYKSKDFIFFTASLLSSNASCKIYLNFETSCLTGSSSQLISN